jgi:glycosyltransferase involved in cell wall biosynthesis
LIKSWYNDAGFENIVHFHGRIPQTEIAVQLRSTHVFVSTSLSDGNNVSLNEAMACGCVSVVTDIPANRQWMKNDVNGYLVPTDNPRELADKILYIYRNYSSMQLSSSAFNKPLIQEKALWSVNMNRVATKYSELTGK